MYTGLHIASHGFTNAFVKLAGQIQQGIQTQKNLVSQASQEGQAATIFFLLTYIMIFKGVREGSAVQLNTNDNTDRNSITPI